MTQVEPVIEQETRRPGRPPRAEKTQTERRRRAGGNASKLAIPDSIKQAYPDMEFRWGRDDDGRIQQLTQSDDWDKVPDVDPIHGGPGRSGGAMKMHLLMKPKAFMAADRSEKMERLTAQEQDALSRPDAKQATATGAEMYSVPGNKL